MYTYIYIYRYSTENLHVEIVDPENSGACQKEHHLLSSPYFFRGKPAAVVFGGRADIAKLAPAAWFYQKKTEVNNP